MVEQKRIEVPDLSPEYETRIIIIAQGIEGHDEDIAKNRDFIKKHPDWYPSKQWSSYVPVFDFLSEQLDGFEIIEDSSKIGDVLSKNKVNGFNSIRKAGIYTNDKQKVKYIIVTVVSKKDFKKALETQRLHVIYSGHSRYGRGACFDTYKGVHKKEGEQWGTGTGDDNGLFRLGYQYVPITVGDVEKHKYFFYPVPVEEDVPPRERKHPFSRHRHARRSLGRIKLPLEVQHFVHASMGSSSNQYYGFRKGKEEYIIVNNGWDGTVNKPYDLGATDLKCMVFCHFGCSSAIHYWHIVRRKEYKGWERPKPPTEKYAYFTKVPSDKRLTNWWLYYILSYDKKNNNESWWNSLEWAKKKANKKMHRIGEAYKIIY